MKTLYFVRDEKKHGDIFDTDFTFDKEEAIASAEYTWNHLSDYDKKRSTVVVWGIMSDDTEEDAETVYNKLMDSIFMPDPVEVIEVSEEE